MYRFLLSWRWLGAFVLALVVAAGCVLLGQWQWDRREERLARNALVTGNYDREPVSLDALVSEPDDPLPQGTEWTPVRLVGTYAGDETRLVRNRPLDGRSGYHVLVPLETQDGDVLLIDRGWLPAGQTGAAPEHVPAPPPGQVTVVARLRPAEPAGSRGAPPGQVQTITPATAGIDSEGLVENAYGVLAQETPAPSEALRAIPRPQIDEGPHLSYALQWFVFALLGFIALGWAANQERRALAEASGTAAPPKPARERKPLRERGDADVEDEILDRR